MALQSSGAISISQIKTELTSSSNSLRTLSAAAGFSTPDAMSEFYGYTSSLPPTVDTFAMGYIEETSITCFGEVYSDNGATITERGFYFGTSTNMTSNPKYTVSGFVGYYLLTRNGLSPNTTYRCWAYATNASGTTYGAMVTATTYQVYNPTWASMYTSAQGVFYGESPNGETQTHDVSYEAFYRNPYSGGYVQYYARSYNESTTGIYKVLYFNGGSRFEGSPGGTAAVNTRNYVRLLYNANPYGLQGGSVSYNYIFMNPASGSFSNFSISGNGGNLNDQSTGSTGYLSAYTFNTYTGLTPLQLDSYFDYA
jgi:hypothetical protein